MPNFIKRPLFKIVIPLYNKFFQTVYLISLKDTGISFEKRFKM